MVPLRHACTVQAPWARGPCLGQRAGYPPRHRRGKRRRVGRCLLL